MTPVQKDLLNHLFGAGHLGAELWSTPSEELPRIVGSGCAEISFSRERHEPARVRITDKGRSALANPDGISLDM